jgi:hypothetical protein
MVSSSVVDPDPSLFVRIRILPSNKKSRKNLHFQCFVTFYDFFIFEDGFVGILKASGEKSRILIRKSVPGTGSDPFQKCHGSSTLTPC